MSALFTIIVLIFSVVLHELAHGYAAAALGDPTARLAGRLSLNPLKHLDWLGSFIVPGILFLLGGFIIGWAKPVPYNPYNLRGGRWGPTYVALAGPVTNLLIALIFGLIIRASLTSLAATAISLLSLVVLINVMLAIFNLIPVPPLDGSKILFALIPARWSGLELWLGRYQWVILFLFLLLIFNGLWLQSLALWIFRLFTGLT